MAEKTATPERALKEIQKKLAIQCGGRSKDNAQLYESGKTHPQLSSETWDDAKSFGDGCGLSGTRTPKHGLFCALSQILEVPVSALEVPYIKSRDELEQLLQALEDEYGLTVTITETRD